MGAAGYEQRTLRGAIDTLGGSPIRNRGRLGRCGQASGRGRGEKDCL